jgi:hypothetical protein
MDEETKVSQLPITLKNHALDWFMILAVNIPQGALITITNVKKALINEFQRTSLEYQYMNDMIEIKWKPGDLV